MNTPEVISDQKENTVVDWHTIARTIGIIVALTAAIVVGNSLNVLDEQQAPAPAPTEQQP